MRWVWRAVPVVLVLASCSLLLTPRGGETVPLYAARTGFMCQTCHFDPNGGGPRNEYGFSFARNRHSLNAPDSTSEWHDLTVVNRLGENLPIYLGLNHRFMMLTNTSLESDSLDRFGFFNMENSLHVTFQPHRRLAMVYSRDGFNAASKTQEAFGMISGFPVNGYLKVGRFRTPFGLRMDDHTTATRNSFLDFSSNPIDPDRFLPYDPRDPDMGLEYGMDQGPFFGRLAFTNGVANVLNGQFAETKTIKLGFNHPWYQGGVSFYDEYRKQPPTIFADRRATRWGYYGLTHYGPFAGLGEIAAGTDEDQSGFKVNKLAFFGELNYAPFHSVNFRVRYDHIQLNRSSDPEIRHSNIHHRYALEGEYDPVPFAELRWTLRRIDHRNNELYGYEDETQAYLQFHFSY